jgi:hypothetical protein
MMAASAAGTDGRLRALGYACETGLWPAGTFNRAYTANRKASIERMIDTDPVATCVRELMSERSSWMGSAAYLLRINVERTGPGSRQHRLAQKSPRTGRLLAPSADISPALGVDISFSREGRNGSRVIRMRRSFENTVSTVSSVRTGPGPIPERLPLGSARVPSENHRTDTRPTPAASANTTDGADGADAKSNFPFL